MPIASVPDGTWVFTQIGYRSRRRIVIVGLATLILVAFGSTTEQARVEQQRATPLLSSSDRPTTSTVNQPRCWVSGDLVGDTNPATVAAALCGK
jgi:hypothetical protein